MTKVFPKSRVCVIDIYPSIEAGLRLALDFTNKNNIRLNTSDGKNILLAFCIKAIQQTHQNTKSSFPKVLCISKKAITNKVQHFVDNYLEQMLQHIPLAYCGKYDLQSPDLENAAQVSLNETKPQRKYNEYLSLLKIRKISQ